MLLFSMFYVYNIMRQNINADYHRIWLLIAQIVISQSELMLYFLAGIICGNNFIIKNARRTE